MHSKLNHFIQYNFFFYNLILFGIYANFLLIPKADSDMVENKVKYVIPSLL